MILPTFTTSASADRRTYYGASEVAVILGLSSFKTAYELWAERTGRTPREDLSASPDIRRGNHLEAGILAMMGDELGCEVVPGPRVHEPAIVAPDVSPYAGCHPDGYIARGGAWEGLEAKAPRRADGWGDEGDDVPPAYWLQCQACMALTGLETWHLGALLYGEVRIHSLAYDHDVARAALARCDAWWARHVIAGEEPPVDASRAASAEIARRVRKGAERPATEKEAALVRRYAELGAATKQAETEREAVKVELLRAICAEPARLVIGAGKGAWGLTPIATAGRVTVDLDALRSSFPDAYAACARQGAPYVQFRTFGLKGQE